MVIGDNSAMVGNILSGGAVTLERMASVWGRIYAGTTTTFYRDATITTAEDNNKSIQPSTSISISSTSTSAPTGLLLLVLLVITIIPCLCCYFCSRISSKIYSINRLNRFTTVWRIARRNHKVIRVVSSNSFDTNE